jgi:hypothetical protein
MKTKFQTFAVLLIAALASLFAQGPLTPPGAPAPTMKSLDQVEARTPISSIPYTIGASGSYYLTKNLDVSSGNAITIVANGVTLDLNGFTISSSEATPAGTGIRLDNGAQNIRIFNGNIKGFVAFVAPTYSGPGFLNGISYSGFAPLNVRVADLMVSGCKMHGIDLGTDYASTAADRCNVRTVGGDGIIAGAVHDCTAYFCGGNGILSSTVANSIGRSSGSGRGIYSVTASNCYGDSPNGPGVDAWTASNCLGGSNTNPGLKATSASDCYGFSRDDNGIQVVTAHGCYGRTDGGSSAGIVATNAINCYGQATSFGIGLEATGIATGCFGTSANGTGLYFGLAGAMCFGSRQNPSASSTVLGAGATGPGNLPP